MNYAQCDIKRMMFIDQGGKSLPLELRRKSEKLPLENHFLTAKKNLLVDHFYRWWILQMIVVVLDALQMETTGEFEAFLYFCWM